MAKSTRDNTKRASRPTQTGTLIGVRIQPDQLTELDEWIARQPDPRPTRPEAIRRLIELGLEAARQQVPKS